MDKHIWIVEYGLGKDWKPDANEDGKPLYFQTRIEALHNKRHHHSGHPHNLRVRKYVREER